MAQAAATIQLPHLPVPHLPRTLIGPPLPGHWESGLVCSLVRADVSRQCVSLSHLANDCSSSSKKHV